MKITPFIYEDNDDLMANTYVISDQKGQCAIIDPSKDYDGVINFIKKNKLLPKGILLTHGHFDHMRGIDKLIQEFDIPLYIGFYDEPNLLDAQKNLSLCVDGKPFVVKAKAITVSDKETLEILSEPITVIETPFHTIGSVCYYLEDSNILFSGDTLFKESVGRSDLLTSSSKDLRSSLNKILSLKEETIVYPGHGSFTSIGYEKKHNPFVN